MNRSIIRYILAKVLEFLGLFLLIPCVVAVIYGEKEGFAYLIVATICGVLGILGAIKKPKSFTFYAREGFVSVALSWILLGIVGGLPFCLTGEIPRFTDAMFETISGFTTTGASILTDVEALSHCSLFWRSFTHWIGGMGVLVFILAILPLSGGNNIHILRAESPGPSVGKLVPKMRQTAMILYGIYFGMTIVQIVLLLIAGMPLFDSLTLSFGTAGTGGFGIKNSSIAGYSTICQSIITTFMILFGVNFNVYFLILLKKWKQAVKCEELRWYLGIILASTLAIAVNLKGYYATFFERLHHSAFQVASIITTTGYSTRDFDQWPSFSKTILVILMFIGACAGSTGGGLKVSRVVIYLKSIKNEIVSAIHPKRVSVLRLEDKAVSDSILKATQSYLAAFLVIFTTSVLFISVDGFDLITNFTAVAATINNIGPGLAVVGPASNFSGFSIFSKWVLIFDMLVGRLEIFPMLVLFSISTWKRGK